MNGATRTAANERRTTRALLAAWWSNLAVWAALLVLLFTSLSLAYVPLGSWNLPVGLIIAATKAALVGYAFMAMRRAPALIILAISAAGLFVVVMFVLTFNDLLTRF